MVKKKKKKEYQVVQTTYQKMNNDTIVSHKIVKTNKSLPQNKTKKTFLKGILGNKTQFTRDFTHIWVKITSPNGAAIREF